MKPGKQLKLKNIYKKKNKKKKGKKKEKSKREYGTLYISEIYSLQIKPASTRFVCGL